MVYVYHTISMTQKELLIAVLERLHDTRDLAEWFLLVVQQTDDVDFLNELQRLIYTSILWITDEYQKKIIKIKLEQMKSLKVKEQISVAQDTKDINNILDTLLNELE